MRDPLYKLQARRWTVLAKSASKGPVLFNLSWSLDGESIYFIDWSPAAPGYYRVRLRDHRIEKVVALGDDVPTIKGTIGGWCGLYNNSALALLNRERGEIYALEWSVP